MQQQGAEKHVPPQPTAPLAGSSSVPQQTEAGAVERLQKHLKLLRDEHIQLQQQNSELQRHVNVLETTLAQVKGGENGDEPETKTKASFVSNLVNIVAELFEKDLYSDITVHLDGHQLRAHRFVLAARSTKWANEDLTAVDKLHLEGISYSIGHALLRWLYTDRLDAALGDNMLIQLMKAAQQYDLQDLPHRCEQILVGRLDVGNCVPIYTSAEEMGAVKLRDKCLQLITSRWADFGASDFAAMDAQLLYKMLRSRDQHPLHSAVRLRREDVVFLYLLEHATTLRTKINECDAEGCVPLSLALATGQQNIASTLVQHEADVNNQQAGGISLLHSAVREGDVDACQFLLEHGADVNFVQSDGGSGILHVLAALDNKPQALGRLLPMLLRHKPAVTLDLQDAQGRTCLHRAVQCGNRLFVEQLLSDRSAAGGVPWDAADTTGGTALGALLRLHGADWHSLAERLLRAGAAVNTCNDKTGNYLLHDNVDSPDNVRFLLTHGADVRALNAQGEHLLHLVASNANEPMLRLLTDTIADDACLADLLNAQTRLQQNSDDPFAVSAQTPLHSALANQHTAVADHLLQVTQQRKLKLDLNQTDSNGDSVLALALTHQHMQVAETLVQLGANLNASGGPRNQPLLIRFIEEDNQPAALFLIKQGASLQYSNCPGSWALQLAVQHNMADVVRALCRAGCALNTDHPELGVPLWQALRAGHLDVAAVLVEQGCDVDAWPSASSGQTDDNASPPHRTTLLHRACELRDETSACFLVRSGCSVDATMGTGKRTALHLAVEAGLTSLVTALLEQGANVNALDGSTTAVHLAVQHSQLECLRLLLASPHVALTTKDAQGRTPFALAMHKGDTKAANLILARDKRVATQFDGKGYNLLHTAVKQGDLECMLFLISVQLDVNTTTQDSNKYTPLHLAAIGAHEMAARNLLLAGADVNALSGRKQSALQLAAAHDNASLCAILLDNHADYSHVDEYLNNALHLAVQAGSLSCVNVLLAESRIDAEAANGKSQTPLHLLACHARQNAPAILATFIESMPQYPLDALDSDGNTGRLNDELLALLLAYMNGQSTLCKSLVHHGACLGQTNAIGINIFNFQTPTKQLLLKLLDQLSAEPKWSEGDQCSECAGRFSLTTRKHHCRHCGRVVCARCSGRETPIMKYTLSKPVRVCDVCHDVLTLGAMDDNVFPH